MTTQHLAGATALVTGGSIGIGRGIALSLARAGARVALTYRSHAPEDSLLDELRALSGAEPLALQVDATDEAQVKNLADAVSREFGRLDVLVNNAGGLVQRATLRELDLDLWHRILSVNLDTTFLITHHLKPLLPQGRGRIINIASLAGHNGGHPGALAYATSKAAIFGFTRSLAREVAPEGITVNALAPGFIEATPFHDTFTTADSKNATIATIPAGRAGVPDDVADAVLWLAGEGSAFVTGTVIDINGGQYVR
ncbi:SDR family NAD(P)-dependent oxidoreductase [Arthrobacter woluwensis]|uniref:3-oxoacyl-[acyl-carrier protein] reductase n=1 Tax=Arthrobacter woluwensis TaxID=156980 RepID=A0A1H4KU50_9MICC|nr:SDR family NAD(P)-dependent oxidoreductase [Arthrobacter woluwensis]SEB61923.1 3-oxoacyl-[acyl-carrier protein] reductase [Arthrobacter woluwensis]